MTNVDVRMMIHQIIPNKKTMRIASKKGRKEKQIMTINKGLSSLFIDVIQV